MVTYEMWVGHWVATIIAAPSVGDAKLYQLPHFHKQRGGLVDGGEARHWKIPLHAIVDLLNAHVPIVGNQGFDHRHTLRCNAVTSFS